MVNTYLIVTCILIIVLVILITIASLYQYWYTICKTNNRPWCYIDWTCSDLNNQPYYPLTNVLGVMYAGRIDNFTTLVDQKNAIFPLGKPCVCPVLYYNNVSWTQNGPVLNNAAVPVVISADDSHNINPNVPENTSSGNAPTCQPNICNSMRLAQKNKAIDPRTGTDWSQMRGLPLNWATSNYSFQGKGPYTNLPIYYASTVYEL